MSEVLKLKSHIRNILDAADLGMYKKTQFRHTVHDNSTEYMHELMFYMEQSVLIPKYSLTVSRYEKDEYVNLSIIPISVEDYTNQSYISFINGGINYRFSPDTMDDIIVKFRSKDRTCTDEIELKYFLTEEQYFMYSTLYDLPEYDDIFMLLVMGQQFREELLKKQIRLSGRISKTVPDIGSYDFMQSVRYS